MPAFEVQLAQIWRYREKCAGTTKRGTPCQHFRRSGSKYCHDHRGGMRHDVCVTCGGHSPYKRECSKCRDARLKEEGRCVDCHGLRGDSESTIRCQPCFEKDTQRGRELRRRRDKRGECLECGQPRGGSRLCERCKERKRRRKRAA